MSEDALLFDFDVHEAVFVFVLVVEVTNVVSCLTQLVLYLYEETFAFSYLEDLHADVLHEHEHCEMQFDSHSKWAISYMVKLGPLWSNWLSPSTTISAYFSFVYFY